jgi:hypothetical protein
MARSACFPAFRLAKGAGHYGRHKRQALESTVHKPVDAFDRMARPGIAYCSRLTPVEPFHLPFRLRVRSPSAAGLTHC